MTAVLVVASTSHFTGCAGPLERSSDDTSKISVDSYYSVNTCAIEMHVELLHGEGIIVNNGKDEHLRSTSDSSRDTSVEPEIQETVTRRTEQDD